MKQLRVPRATWAPTLTGLAIGLSACVNSRDISETTVFRDSAGIRITSIGASAADLPMWELRESGVTISGTGESGAPYFESRIEARWLSRETVLVIDTDARRFHLFGSSGNYLGSFGQEGRGPGELGSIDVVTTTPGDTIHVYDRSRRAMVVFHPDSGYVRSVTFADPPDGSIPIAVWPAGENRFVRYAYRAQAADLDTYIGQIGRRPSIHVLTLIDEAGGLLSQGIELDGGYTAVAEFGEVRLPFSNIPRVFVRDTRVLFGTGQEFQLTELDSTWRRVREIRWPTIAEPLTSKEVEGVRKQFVRRFPATGDRLASTALAAEFLPEMRPGLGPILVDGQGRIWVARFEPPPFPPYHHEATWYVLDREGRPLARLRLPRNAHLTEVKHNRLLIVTRDDFDVPSVGIFHFVPE